VNGVDSMLGIFRLAMFVTGLSMFATAFIEFFESRTGMIIISTGAGLIVGAFLPTLPVFAAFFALLGKLAAGHAILTAVITGLSHSFTIAGITTTLTYTGIMNHSSFRKPIAHRARAVSVIAGIRGTRTCTLWPVRCATLARLCRFEAPTQRRCASSSISLRS
jgi:hypothetical protein